MAKAQCARLAIRITPSVIVSPTDIRKRIIP